MTTFQSALSVHDDWQIATQACLEQLTPIEGQPLAFIFISDRFHEYFTDIVVRLKHATGIVDWVGTEGMGILGPGQEVYEQGAISVLITDLTAPRYRLIPSVTKTPETYLNKERAWIEQQQPFFGILHGDPRNEHVAEMITQFSEGLGCGFFVGGLTSHSANIGVQYAGVDSSGGLSGALFGADVKVVSGVTQGCSPISDAFEITHCERNIIATLDHKPALNVLLEAAGEPGQGLDEVAENLFLGLPIAGRDKHDYLVRNLVGVDEKNHLIAIGDMVQAGQSLIFCRRDEETAVHDMQRMLEDVKKRSENCIKGGLYYTCLGRGRAQFGVHSEELKLIQNALGDIPLAGFYANGEISHNQLYGYTGVLLLFC